jgi:hypothetical protein
VALENKDKGGEDPKRAKKRDDLKEKLAKVYRELDEAGA